MTDTVEPWTSSSSTQTGLPVSGAHSEARFINHGTTLNPKMFFEVWALSTCEALRLFEEKAALEVKEGCCSCKRSEYAQG